MGKGKKKNQRGLSILTASSSPSISLTVHHSLSSMLQQPLLGPVAQFSAFLPLAPSAASLPLTEASVFSSLSLDGKSPISFQFLPSNSPNVPLISSAPSGPRIFPSKSSDVAPPVALPRARDRAVRVARPRPPSPSAIYSANTLKHAQEQRKQKIPQPEPITASQSVAESPVDSSNLRRSSRFSKSLAPLEAKRSGEARARRLIRKVQNHQNHKKQKTQENTMKDSSEAKQSE